MQPVNNTTDPVCRLVVDYKLFSRPNQVRQIVHTLADLRIHVAIANVAAVPGSLHGEEGP